MHLIKEKGYRTLLTALISYDPNCRCIGDQAVAAAALGELTEFIFQKPG